jgi:hypothetical protein
MFTHLYTISIISHEEYNPQPLENDCTADLY